MSRTAKSIVVDLRRDVDAHQRAEVARWRDMCGDLNALREEVDALRAEVAALRYRRARRTTASG